MSAETSGAGTRVDAAGVVARARAAVDADGRLPAPDLTTWETFPFEGDLLVKRPADPVLPEPPRRGEGGAAACPVCARGDEQYVWTSDRWRLTLPPEPVPVPTVLLEPRAHLDIRDLDDAMAAELGQLTVRLMRAGEAVPGVGRVHAHRIGDGVAHLHLWFIARPAGLLQLRGSCLMDWLDVLPAMPREQLEAFAEQVSSSL
jgi:diadenosine tetraphosphate (Ap4A) HIT family hydrolase